MKNKAVFITGGSDGIGKETAKIFAKQGFIVGIMARRPEKIDEAKNEIGENCFGYVGDVSKANTVQSALDDFMKHTQGQLDLLVNNTGVCLAGSFEAHSLAEYQSMVDINVMGVINCTYLALPFLKKTNGAQIINVSSASAVYGNPELTVYAATKSAVQSLTEGWSMGLKKYGIKVSDVMPVYVKTAMLEKDVAPNSGANVKKKAMTAETAANLVWKNYSSYKIHRIKGSLAWWQNIAKALLPHEAMAKMILDYTRFK